MLRKSVVTVVAASSLIAQPVLAEDDPNAAVKAQTAAIEAETAKINADAARITAQATRDKATIDGLGLPKFDNKTSLENDGGAIETAMLATRAISAAATTIGGAVGCKDDAGTAQNVVVLAGNEKLDLNAGKVLSARLDNFSARFSALLTKPRPKPNHNLEWSELLLSPATVVSAVSAVAGLLGSDTTVSGVKLPEIDDHMLANAVAGQLRGCAVLPSAGAGMIADSDPLRVKLDAVITLRNQAAVRIAQSPDDKDPVATALGSAVTDFDAFLKDISTTDANGQTAFVQASLAEKIASMPNLRILRVAVNRSGGTITNTKNIGTYFGTDPIRVSGGLVASYALVDADSGIVRRGDTIACQTARVKLREVQSGQWSTGGGKANQGNAICKASSG